MIENLIQKGYWVCPQFLDATTVSLVAQEIESLQKNAEFKRAGIGSHQRVESIRGDWTHWWELQALTPLQREIFGRLEKIQAEMNRELYLGLWDFEGHYAVYPSGTFYRTHLDRFDGDDRRALSVVLFFNEDWDLERDGGGLEIESLTKEKVIVSPSAGTLVCFLSEKIPHQVLETKRERKSFAGWFRRRAVTK